MDLSFFEDKPEIFFEYFGQGNREGIHRLVSKLIVAFDQAGKTCSQKALIIIPVSLTLKQQC